MKQLGKIASGLLLLVGLLGIFGIRETSAHTIIPQAMFPLATCKEMNEVAVVVATGEKFQRICVAKGSERAFSKVRAICNYTDVVVSFLDSNLEKRFEINPGECQKFDLDDGVLIVPSEASSHRAFREREIIPA